MLNFGTLCSQRCTFLLSSLLGGKTLSVGGDETVVLLVEPGLTLLKAFPLLECSRDVRLYTLHLALNLLLGLVKLASDGVLVVTLLVPFGFPGRSFLGFFFGNATQILCLNGKIGGRIISLANVLCKLKDALALALVTASGVGKAIPKGIHLFLDISDGCLVVFLIPLQAIPLLLQLLVGRSN